MTESRNGNFTEELLHFVNTGPTPFQAVDNAARLLEARGFARLGEGDAWKLEKGGRYWLMRNASALVAFEVGDGDPAVDGFRLIGAHTDSPSFKIKPGPCLVGGDGYTRLNTEAYGGAILSTWLDRPLSIAGRATLRGGDGALPTERLIDFRRPLAVIPNLCVHFNRDVNNGYVYNKQIDMLPLLGMAKEMDAPEAWLLDMIADELDAPREAILDYELFLYEAEPGKLIGPNEEFISAPRLDNLSLAYAALDGLLHAAPCAATKVIAAFDNEEVGSAAAPGAASAFLPTALRRIVLALGGGDGDGYFRACANSAAISADCAHAVHPNHPDKHDPANRPVLGEGPAIKYSADQKYATNSVTAALFMAACEAAGVPCQQYVNRSDIRGGSTIGPALASRTAIPTVDVGTPILAMHSIRELGHVDDAVFAALAFREFYGSEL